MANEKTPIPPIVAPRAGGVTAGGDIIVRQFQPSDAPQVHALLLEGLVYGPESPRNTALRRSLTRPVALSAYAAFSLGLACLSRPRCITLRPVGGALCIASLVLLLYFWHSIHIWFINYCLHARRTDMADIMKTYEIPTDSTAVQGPGGFFVAAIESPDDKTSEVVGYLGLDYRTNDDPTSGEFRRMMVSSRHRRRKIASLLITAAMAHARTRSPPLLTMDLETTEFQPGARKLYERHGFAVVGSSLMREGLFFRARMLRLRRKVAE